MKPIDFTLQPPLHFNYFPDNLKIEQTGIQIQIIKQHQVEFIVMYKVSKNNLRRGHKALQPHNSD